jgi:hypothetical protein
VDEDPLKLVAAHAATLMHFVNQIGWLASPRLVAKAQQMPSREHLLGHADQYIALLEHAKRSPENPGNQSMVAAEPEARKLRALFQSWEPSTDVPPEITQAARAFLAAYGIPDPPDGWDAFEGWPDAPEVSTKDEPPSPKPQPSLRQVYAASLLGGMLVGPFQLGIGGPGGWVILDRPEIHFGEDVIVPDLAAWAAERAPSPTDDLDTAIIPDWVCEIHTMQTRELDYANRMTTYARDGVRFVWVLVLGHQIAELYRLNSERQWLLSGVHSALIGPSRVRIEPFDSIEIDLALLLEKSLRD